MNSESKNSFPQKNVVDSEEKKKHPGCNQNPTILLDVCHTIYQKFLIDMHHHCSNVDLQIAIDEALQILFVEIRQLEMQGEKCYTLLLNLLQIPMLEEVSQTNKLSSWGSLIKTLEQSKILQDSPYKILFFFFRALSLILFTVKSEVMRTIKQTIAANLLRYILQSTIYLKTANRICPLKDIFAYCRKNTLIRDNICECRISVTEPTLTQVFAKPKLPFSSLSPQIPKLSSPTNTAKSDNLVSLSSDTPPAKHNSMVLDDQMMAHISQILSNHGKTSADKQTMSPCLVGETSMSSVAFSGDLKQISLWQILQVLGMEKSPGYLQVKTPELSAKIYLDSGRMTHCECGDLVGEDAFFSLANVKEGQFSFVPQTQAPNPTMDHLLEALLLQIVARME